MSTLLLLQLRYCLKSMWDNSATHSMVALLSQLDLAANPNAANAVMLLIAEAAIEASEYVDAA